MEVRILGPLEVLDDAGTPIPMAGGRLRCLAALLALTPGQTVASGRLIEEIWGDESPRSVVNALQALVSKLRRAIGAEAIVTEPTGYALAVPADAVDVHRFERLSADGRAAMAAGDPAGASRLLTEALKLWRGPALADLTDAVGTVAAATRLEELRASVVEDRFEAELAAGRHAEAVAELEAAVATSPFRERLRGQLMLALYRSGRQADALRSYQDARSVLVEELGLEPGAELRRLESAMLAHDPSLDAPAPAPPMSAAAVETSSRPRTNLRPARTRFVGREHDVDTVCALLAGNRLVSLVGAGGAGKTRLAAEVAGRHADSYADGVWMVALDTVASPDEVDEAVATALGMAPADAMAARTAECECRDRLRDFVPDRELLLVLDNCEHVIEAAAVLAEDLLSAGSGLRVITTSREALRLPGEVVWPVPPLATDDAVELFVERARAATPTFELDETTRPVVEELCGRLDGMPLAIELAAARTRAFTVEQLAGRLDDRFRILTGGSRTALPRQQTLRAVVDWSYELLFDDERRVFERLSVFAGGCTLEGAEAVCSDGDVPPEQVGEVVARLVDKSLVVADGRGRFRLLLTLAQYGRERLAARGEMEAIRDRHAAWFAALAAASEPALRGEAQARWVATISDELDDIRAAMEWALARPDAPMAHQIAGRLGWFWWCSGYSLEGHRRIEAALACPGDVPIETRAASLAWSAWLAMFAGERDVALDRGFEAYELARSLDDKPSISVAASIAGFILMTQGERTRGAEILEEARDAYRAQGEWGEGLAMFFGAELSMLIGDRATAESQTREAIEVLRRTGDLFTLSYALFMLSDLLEWDGRYADAAATIEESLEMTHEYRLAHYEAGACAKLGNLSVLMGDADRAEQLHQDALEMTRELALPVLEGYTLNGMGLGRRRTGRLDEARECHLTAYGRYVRAAMPNGAAFAASSLGYVAEEAGDLDEAERWHHQGLEHALQVGDPRTIALALEGLAGVAAASGDGAAAARLLGKAAALREGALAPLPAPERVDVDRAESLARAKLGDDTFGAEFASGSEADIDTLVG